MRACFIVDKNHDVSVYDQELTASEWFKVLNEPYRSQAIKNTIDQYGEPRLAETAFSLYDALDHSMVWSKTPQGEGYWIDIANCEPDSKFIDTAIKSWLHPKHVLGKGVLTEKIAEKENVDPSKISVLAYDTGCDLTTEQFLEGYENTSLPIKDTLFNYTEKRYLKSIYTGKEKLFSLPEVKAIYIVKS